MKSSVGSPGATPLMSCSFPTRRRAGGQKAGELGIPGRPSHFFMLVKVSGGRGTPGGRLWEAREEGAGLGSRP